MLLPTLQHEVSSSYSRYRGLGIVDLITGISADVHGYFAYLKTNQIFGSSSLFECVV